MDGLLRVRLEAHNPVRNHHRWYEVRLGRDLFGRWAVTIGYGRSGFSGRSLTYSDEELEVVKAVIRHFLDRRASAPRRIGCAYRTCELSAAPGVRAEDWLPPGWLPSRPLAPGHRRNGSPGERMSC